ncbi:MULTISPECIES: helical backbone metal receptor [unclassified Streptomyces]|uniref:helical backbone metal receptor n=1 Tax=unclassified Streptomyces TaxID=2593676 RepID=UPI0033EBF52C
MTLARGPRRVVSLVPSLTEAVAVTVPGALVGATEWCSHPADLDVTRVGGTKNPDVPAVVALAPDLVIANEEENRAPDLAALRAAGLEVLVTEVRTVEQAFRELARVLAACGAGRPEWLVAAEAAWREPQGLLDARDLRDLRGLPDLRGLRDPHPAPGRLRAAVPIWRRPWMVLGRDTFAGDVLARLGVDNAYAGHAERYPRVPVDELRSADLDLVVLPDEPYRFTREDGPEEFVPRTPVALVGGRHLTWYGPSLTEAPAVLSAALRAAFR